MSTARRYLDGALTAAAILFACAIPAAAAAQAGDAARIVSQGNGRGGPACVTCHGPRMLGNALLGYPRLAGLDAAYLEAQLQALASGQRKNAVMLPIASSLTADERRALAAYLGSLPVPASLPPAADSAAPPVPTPEQLALGEVLATRGRWSNALPGCDQCHGPGGVGVGPAFPPLAGQSALYLANQMAAWKQGTRPAGPLGLMGAVAQRMSDADITAVAAFYSTLPTAPQPPRSVRP